MRKQYSDRKKFLDRVYTEINKSSEKYGKFKKCELHIHTPASNCYRFITEEDKEKRKYSELSTRQIIDYCFKIGYFNEEKYRRIINDLDQYECDEYVEKIKNEGKPYNSFKEYVTYMTIAYKLFLENIEVAVISDHNTVDGYEKLKYAINKYYKENKFKLTSSIKLFLGVEVSCSDRNHLMIIYNDEEKCKLEHYLEEIILSKELGSFYDTRKIVDDMKDHDAITYICHINTSDLLGNDAYKKKLFSSRGLNGIGLTNIENIENQKNRIRKYNKEISRFAIVYEGDSHAISEIGVKNTWIKLSRNITFNSLKKAFINHQICIYTAKPKTTSKYIKGLAINGGEKGFLVKKEYNKNISKDDILVINFSEDLNCIIGGRGSGKSTLLNILEIMYSMECDDLDLLTYISQNERIYSIFVKDECEYLLEFIPQVSLKHSYSDSRVVFIGSYIKEDNLYKLKPQWYNIFKIEDRFGKNEYEIIDKKEYEYLLKDVFRRGYNINKLVYKIQDKQISKYIKEVISYNESYDDINGYTRKIIETSKKSVLKVIRESLGDLTLLLNYRREVFYNLIKEFNNNNSDLLIIEYNPMNEIGEYYDIFLSIFKINIHNSSSSEQELKRNVCNTNLTWGDVQDYFQNLIKKINYIEILNLLLNKKFKKMNEILPIEEFQTDEATFESVENQLEEVTKENRGKVYKEIFNKVKFNEERLKESIIASLKVMDNFTMKFNINYKEDVKDSSKNFKNIREISLGQKVVALLTFVFNYGSISGDNTPLIIDQPEDNLDNVYIYKTLVNSLRMIKNSRQVIVVTHSSTIVTNADAEEVIVMKSDGKRGWIEKSGYPSDKIITKHIINYLEGGKESFNHKVDMYNVILNE